MGLQQWVVADERGTIYAHCLLIRTRKEPKSPLDS